MQRIAHIKVDIRCQGFRCPARVGKIRMKWIKIIGLGCIDRLFRIVVANGPTNEPERLAPAVENLQQIIAVGITDVRCWNARNRRLAAGECRGHDQVQTFGTLVLCLLSSRADTEGSPI